MGLIRAISRNPGKALLGTMFVSGAVGAGIGLYARHHLMRPQTFPPRSFPTDGKRYQFEAASEPKSSWTSWLPSFKKPSWWPGHSGSDPQKSTEMPYKQAASRLTSSPSFTPVNFNPSRGDVHPSWHENGLGGVNVRVNQQDKILADLLETPGSASLVSGPGIPSDRPYVMFSLTKSGQQPATVAVGVNPRGELMDVRVQAMPDGQFQSVASQEEPIADVQRKLSGSLQPYFNQQYTIATPSPSTP
jgi:hypothetical protein